MTRNINHHQKKKDTCTAEQVTLHTDSEPDLLLLIGQSIIIVEFKLQALALIGQQLPLQAKQHAEVAFTAHHPNGVTGSLQVSSYLRGRKAAKSSSKYQDQWVVACEMPCAQSQAAYCYMIGKVVKLKLSFVHASVETVFQGGRITAFCLELYILYMFWCLLICAENLKMWKIFSISFSHGLSLREKWEGLS